MTGFGQNGIHNSIQTLHGQTDLLPLLISARYWPALRCPPSQSERSVGEAGSRAANGRGEQVD